VYTRNLIPRIYIDPFEIDKNFDEAAWPDKKAHGPDAIIARKTEPERWIMVDGNPCLFPLLDQ
jgi:hypothetical protein